ncbi:interleukin-12 subunit alpha [Odontesthes bonariensis]|uniref:interleukin-12 subunit alpha n=1 Tax=Odontesthes bonariensis TaxID=219752 RepID=UPI003F58A7FE
MPLIKLYFTSALLLLALSCRLWQVSQSLPVMGKGPMTDSCTLYARTLLQNITDALAQTKLFSGIDCAKQNLELNMETSTPSVCTPLESACPGITKSQFDQESCVTNIGEDLSHYYKFLTNQPDPEKLLGPTVLLSLRELMENCFKGSLPTDLALKEDDGERASTYNERLNLCKVLRGFQVRTITINRAINYMNSK